MFGSPSLVHSSMAMSPVGNDGSDAAADSDGSPAEGDALVLVQAASTRATTIASGRNLTVLGRDILGKPHVNGWFRSLGR